MLPVFIAEKIVKHIDKPETHRLRLNKVSGVYQLIDGGRLEGGSRLAGKVKNAE